MLWNTLAFKTSRALSGEWAVHRAAAARHRTPLARSTERADRPEVPGHQCLGVLVRNGEPGLLTCRRSVGDQSDMSRARRGPEVVAGPPARRVPDNGAFGLIRRCHAPWQGARMRESPVVEALPPPVAPFNGLARPSAEVAAFYGWQSVAYPPRGCRRRDISVDHRERIARFTERGAVEGESMAPQNPPGIVIGSRSLRAHRWVGVPLLAIAVALTVAPIAAATSPCGRQVNDAQPSARWSSTVPMVLAPPPPI
jgi:hypothetical protein